MSPSFKYLRQTTVSILVIVAASMGHSLSAQTFNQFRLVGTHTAVNSGYVTSIHFEKDRDTATIDFLNVAGISEQLIVQLGESTAIPQGIPVFMPAADFLQPAPASLDLGGVEFFYGSIRLDDERTPPPHWFRLTWLDERWSGVFRIDNRIYSIDRYTSDQTILVRPALHGDRLFRPDMYVRVSAVIDENYVDADIAGDLVGMDNMGHLFALESIHILDGLLSDSHGAGLRLEQLIYQTSEELGSKETTQAMLNDAERWSDSNASAFGLTDNLATIFFRGDQPGNSITDPYAHAFNDHIAVIGNTPNYQFVTAHVFGRVLELPFESNTILHYRGGQEQPLPDVLWSQNQQQHLVDNPLPASLVQIINYDEPEISETPEDNQPDAVNQGLLIAERPEFESIVNENETSALANTSAAQPSGSGTFTCAALILLTLRRCRRVNVRTS